MLPLLSGRLSLKKAKGRKKFLTWCGKRSLGFSGSKEEPWWDIGKFLYLNSTYAPFGMLILRLILQSVEFSLI